METYEEAQTSVEKGTIFYIEQTLDETNLLLDMTNIFFSVGGKCVKHMGKWSGINLSKSHGVKVLREHLL